jgi:hypothetical protein
VKRNQNDQNEKITQLPSFTMVMWAQTFWSSRVNRTEANLGCSGWREVVMQTGEEDEAKKGTANMDKIGIKFKIRNLV